MFSSTRVAVGAGLLALVAVGTAGVAAAEPSVVEADNVFIAELAESGIAAPPRAEAIHYAHSVCDALAGDEVTPTGVAAATSDFTSMDFDESKVFVYIAVEAYCAQHMDKF
jgi:hypothetical protein